MKRKKTVSEKITKVSARGIILTMVLGSALCLPTMVSAQDYDNTTINGSIILAKGDTATNVTVGKGSKLISFGGTINGAVINDGGCIRVGTSGNSASNITVNNGSLLTSYPSITDKITINAQGQLLVSHQSTVNDVTDNGGNIYIGKENTKTNNLTLNSGKLNFCNTNSVNMTWGNVKDYTLNGKSNLNGGTIDLAHEYFMTTNDLEDPGSAVLRTDSYRTLTIDDLNGNGTTFILRTDLASEANGDKIIVNKASAGSGGIIDVIDDSSVTKQEVLGKKALLVVDDKSGVTNWKAGTGLGLGGIWEYTPTIQRGDSIGKDDYNWYVTNIDKQESPVAEARIEGTESDYALWRDALNNDMLRQRLGDLRDNKESHGLWARFKTGKNSGNSFEGSYHTYQLGWDAKKGNTIYGLALDHSTGSSNQMVSDSQQTMNAVSLYATNYHPSGAYSDIVLRAGKMNSDINMSGLYDDSYSTNAWAYGLSYELGKKITNGSGWFIEPQGQISFGYLKSGDFTSSKDVLLHRDATKSVIGRLGFTLGRNINKHASFFLEGNVYHDFAGKTNVTLSTPGAQSLTEETDFGGTWTELGLGTNIQLSKKMSLHGDVSKTFGGTIKKKWQANIGLRWSF